MADDNRNRGQRPNDPYGRARPAAAQPAGDPLAELARLIGQQNESVPPQRQSQGGVRIPLSMPRAPTQKAAPEVRAQPQDDYGSDQYAPQAGYPDAYGNTQTPGYGQNAGGEQQYDPRYDANAQYADPNYNDPNDGRYAQPQAHAQYGDDNYQDTRYQDPRYDDPRYAGYDPNAHHAAGQGYADPNAAPYGYAQDQSQYADQAGHLQAGYSQYDDGQQGYSDQYYNQPGYAQPPYAQQAQGQSPYGQSPYGQSPYGQMPQAVTRPIGEEPVARRRGGLVTVLAILALAVVGTATAFGYRAMFGTSGGAVPPPVIQADNNPSKIVPAADPNGKPIQDRIGAAGEKLVPREEQPIEMRDPARAGASRVVFPNLAGQGQPVANVAPAGAAGLPAQSEPKRVRTVTIKPDQGSEAPVPTARSSQARSASAAPTTVDDILNNPSSNGPLALSPTNQPQAAPTTPAAPSQRHAARTPAAGSPFPAPLTTGTSGGAAAGAYAVQVTSQRTETDAQASYRSLQQQFPSVLGSRQPVIRRADLGAKGTYYRAQLHFGTQGEASEFCGSLKAAGGQCVVQRN